MYDQSFLELEEIMGDKKWSFEVLDAKFLACKGAKKWEHAEAYANLIRVHHPHRVDGWLNQAECLCELHSAENAVEALLLDEERFKECARYIYAIGPTTPWLMRYNEQESIPKERSRWMVLYGQSLLKILRLIRFGIVFESCPSNSFINPSSY
jgi:hypothetical protein